MSINLSRRTFIGAAASIGATASLPFLRIPGARAAENGILTFGLSSYPPNLQPWSQSGTAAGTVKLLIHRGLLSYGPKGEYTPELAESWANENPTTWVFKLRPNAKFSNGNKVTSADVKWCIEQIAAEKSTAFFRSEFQGIAQVDTPNDETVRIITKEPISTLPLWFASYNLPIIPKGSDLSNPIGAGPFVITGQERGASITLEASPHYYKAGFPKLKGIQIVVYADENLRVAALQAGNVDLIEYVPWQSMDAVAANNALKLDAVDGPFMCLLFNGAKKPFGDPRVRKAIAHSIRREDIVKAAFFGRGTPLAHLPISNDSPFFNADLADGWKYDPTLAKKLLAEAGVGSGFSCNILSTAQYGMLKSTAEVVQQHLAEVGIQAELNLPDWSTRVQLANRGQFDIAVHGTAADSNDPDALTSFLDGSLPPSISRSTNLPVPKIQTLLKAGRAEFDLEKRKAIYHEMEKVALEEVPMVGLCWRKQGYAMQSRVNGFKNLPGQLTFFSGVTLEGVSLA
ncbi:peptide ABC transporter substrate-binding protein [Microvirga sp. BT688]|nr:peptide ABC transporter substrate-binding protein [Microvirga sp.]